MRNPNIKRRQSGFTLIEIMITVGIIAVLSALVLAGVLAAKKHATQIRISSDLALIGNALEAYKTDFGTYPVFADPLTDQAADNAAVPSSANGSWLDRDAYGVRGAVLLCRALIGPGPANSSNDSNDGYPPRPGDDGADGPGFRIRRTIAGVNGNGTPVMAGKVYGPYLDASKFQIEYVTPPNPVNTLYPMQDPVIFESNGGDWTEPTAPGTAYHGNPILYYPANPGTPTANVGYVELNYTVTITSNALPRFNGYDNYYFFRNPGDFQTLAAQCGTPPYLLWSAGLDGVFGLDPKGKTDDITNFDIPANLKK